MHGEEVRGMSIRKILIVDDEEDIRDILRRQFAGLGREVETAGSAAEALEILGRDSFDVMLMDLRMPDVSGSELLVRARSTAPGTELVVLTGYAGCLESRRLREMGASEVLLKPVSTAVLGDTFRRLASARGRNTHSMKTAVVVSGSSATGEMRPFENWTGRPWWKTA
jgi:CheY-like chemotaxis protein